MKIIELRAENVKALKAISIRPDSDIVTISGKNGAGKSSVLDAIWYALGGKDAIPGEPIRKGEKTADVILDLGEYTVHRRFTEGGTRLEVKSKDGAKYSSPQKMLDGMLASFAFDPWEFVRLKPDEQRERLCQLVGLDTSEEDEQIAEWYENRRDAARREKEVRARLDAFGEMTDPGGRVDVAALQDEIDHIDDEARIVASYKRDRERTADNRQKLIEALEELERRAAEIKTSIALDDEALERIDSQIAALPKPDEGRREELREQISQSAEINRAVDEYERYLGLCSGLDDAVSELENAGHGLRLARVEKNAKIESTDMPLPDLLFDDAGLLYRNVPFDQASSAEQLRVAIAICMAANPKLRVARIQDGSLLDEDSLAMLEAAAKEHDFQVWIERVDSSGEVGIYIEDGEVKAESIEAA